MCVVLVVNHSIWPGKVGAMSSKLTLLFLCNPSEQHALFVSALTAANFQLVVAHHEEQAKRLLSTRTVNAIVIHHSAIKRIGSLCESLKRVAPTTPILRIGDGFPGPQPGVDAVYRVDLQDEVLTHAVAIFLQQSLAKNRSRAAITVSSEEAELLAWGANSQVAI
jgi:hypothetical protein